MILGCPLKTAPRHLTDCSNQVSGLTVGREDLFEGLQRKRLLADRTRYFIFMSEARGSKCVAIIRQGYR